MNTQWISIVALAAWLILAVSAYRSHRLSGRTMVKHALVWGTIFLVVAVAFTAIGS